MLKRLILSLILTVAMAFGVIGVDNPVYAAGHNCGDNGVETSILGSGGCFNDDGKGGGVYEILAVVVDILTYGVGALGTLGLAIASIQYLTAGDSDQKAAKAKMRIYQVVLGLIVYALMWAGLQWLIPGGVF